MINFIGSQYVLLMGLHYLLKSNPVICFALGLFLGAYIADAQTTKQRYGAI